MFSLEHGHEATTFIFEGGKTIVLGSPGSVDGTLLPARDPKQVALDERFAERGVIPVIADEHFLSNDRNVVHRLTELISSGIWPGFVTFGSANSINTRELRGEQSHFLVILREVAGSGFIVVVDNDLENNLRDPNNRIRLSTQLSEYDGRPCLLSAESANRATIKIQNDSK